MVAVALSGCTSTPHADKEDDASAQDDPVPTPLTNILTFTDCTIQSALIAAPSEIVAGEIPEGFAPVYGDAAGATSLIGFSGTSCTNTTSQDDPSPHAEFRFYAFVEPAAEWLNGSVDDYALLFFVTTSDESVAKVYQEWGHWVETRDVEVSADEVGASTMGTVRSSHGSEEWEIRTAVDPGTEECHEDKHVRSFAEGPDGIQGYVDLRTDASCAWHGNAKVMLPDVPAGEPMDVAVWAALNGILTGQGRHVVDVGTVTQSHAAFV